MDIKELQYSREDLDNRVKGTSKRLDEVLDAYSKRRFYIGDVDIPRKTLNSWKNFGLLPYKLEEGGWQKLSFIECCWLLTIKEFSQLGVSLSKILLIKKELFPSQPEKIMEIYGMAVDKSHVDVKTKQLLLTAYDHPNAKSVFKKLIKDYQYSLFSPLIQGAVSEGKNIYLVYDKQNHLQIIFFDLLKDKKAYDENIQAIGNILQEAFVGINLKSIALDFLLKEKKRHNSMVLDFLNPAEARIVDLVREKNLKEITISYNNNEPATIYVTRNEPSEQVIHKVASYLKRGSFKKVEFRTRDGQLINYNETDIMKLN